MPNNLMHVFQIALLFFYSDMPLLSTYSTKNKPPLERQPHAKRRVFYISIPFHVHLASNRTKTYSYGLLSSPLAVTSGQRVCTSFGTDSSVGGKLEKRIRSVRLDRPLITEDE